MEAVKAAATISASQPAAACSCSEKQELQCSVPGLTIGSPDDEYEKEADAMADRVLNMQIPPPMNFSVNQKGNQGKSTYKPGHTVVESYGGEAEEELYEPMPEDTGEYSEAGESIAEDNGGYTEDGSESIAEDNGGYTEGDGMEYEEEAALLTRIDAQPASWMSIQQMAKRPGLLISGPPVAKSLADIAAGGGAGAAGYTDWPSGYVAPDFEFNATQTGTDWFARPTRKATANEGTSGSFYTRAGKHKTTRTEGGKDVYWKFSAAISDLVKVGEQEHCDDFAEAYKISLKEADTIIGTNLAGKTFGPKPTKGEAEDLVRAEITNKLTHPGLGNDKTRWSGIYSTLYNKTLTRDSSGWHSISTANRSVDGAGNVVYDIVAGTSQIGTKPSSTIIKY